MKTLREVSGTYAEAEDRLQELRQKLAVARERKRAQVTALEQNEDIDRAAEQLLSEGETALDAPSIRQEIERLAREERVVMQAISKAEQALEYERTIALRKLGEHIKGDYYKVARRQALALVELAEAMRGYHLFERDLPGSIQEMGLRQFPLRAALGSPDSGRVAAQIRHAVDAGLVKSSEVPDFVRQTAVAA